ncbi:MAG: class I SAM-dependent methyltransferase [Christensenellales bacterium]
MSFWENTRKPVGLGGKLMVSLMNLGHSPVARWGFRFLNVAPDAKVLDCGCGGGANIKRMLKKCPRGIVKGIDYSPVSVEKSQKGQCGRHRKGALHDSARQCGEKDLRGGLV